MIDFNYLYVIQLLLQCQDIAYETKFLKNQLYFYYLCYILYVIYYFYETNNIFYAKESIFFLYEMCFIINHENIIKKVVIFNKLNILLFYKVTEFYSYHCFIFFFNIFAAHNLMYNF